MTVDENRSDDFARATGANATDLPDSGAAGLLTEDDQIVLAELVSPPRPLWPAIVVVMGAIWLAILTSASVLVAAALVRGEMELLVDSQTRTRWIADLAASRFGLLVLLLPSQLVFLAAAAGAAWMSRDPWRERLGLGTGRLPVWTWWLFLAGTPAINMVSSRLITLVADEPSEQLQMLERIFRFDSWGAFLTLLLLVGMMPGLVEELLFRGYMQRRLLARLHPIVAISICSLFFAAAHMDPMHALGVLPLGIWLGFVAWRADSIWPAVCGHVGNNSFAIVMARVMGTEADVEQVGLTALVIVGTTLLSLGGAIAALAVLGGHNSKSKPDVVC